MQPLRRDSTATGDVEGATMASIRLVVRGVCGWVGRGCHFCKTAQNHSCLRRYSPPPNLAFPHVIIRSFRKALVAPRFSGVSPRRMSRERWDDEMHMVHGRLLKSNSRQFITKHYCNVFISEREI